MNTRAKNAQEVPPPGMATPPFPAAGGVYEVQGDALKRIAGNETVEASEMPALDAAGEAAKAEVKP